MTASRPRLARLATAPLTQPVEIRHKLPPLRALTAIRFFAAMHVVLSHESNWAGHIRFFPAAARVVASGYTAVTFFFVLSGFILAYNYGQVRSKAEFWVARFARIYPVYLLSLLPPILITPHWSYHPRPGALGVFLAFTLLQAWIPALAYSLNMVAWTLSVEAFFYALFPFLLPWVERLRARGFLVLQGLWLLVVCVPLVLALHPRTFTAGFWIAIWLERQVPILRLNPFLLGVYAGVQFRRSVLRLGNEPRFRPATQAMSLLGVAAVVLFLLWLQPAMIFLPLRTEGLQVFSAVFIWLLADVNWGFLTNHAMQMAGEISYSIYILQFPVLFAFDDLMHRLFPGSTHISVLYIAVLCGVAYLTFRFVEVPARLLIRRAFTGRPVPVRAV